MFIELPCRPCVGVSRGVMYIGKGDGTFEELCAVTDIPEITSNAEEEVENKINLDHWHGMEFTFEIRSGTKSCRNLKRASYCWKAKGPIRKLARSKAFKISPLWRFYVI